MITRAKLSTIEQGLPKYRSMLAGNDYYIPSSFESIATATPTSGTSVTFSSIPSTYKHLQIRANIRMGLNEFSNVTFNGVGGTSYAWHSLYSRTSLGTVEANSSASTGAYQPANYNNNTSGTYPNVMIMDILDYASTSKNKTIKVIAGCDDNGGGYNEISLSSGLFTSTNAITSITISYLGGTFATGTSIALYGIKG